MAAIAAAVVLHNCGYLWIYKQRQFIERALPTVALAEALKSTHGPVVVNCFSYSRSIAQKVAIIAAETDPARLIFRNTKDCESYRFTPAPLPMHPGTMADNRAI
jgi:hypothetical protein